MPRKIYRKHRKYLPERPCAVCRTPTPNLTCCSRSCSGKHHREKPSALKGIKRLDKRRPIRERFYEFIGAKDGIVPSIDECWPWYGNWERKTGNALISARNKNDEPRQTYATRISWELFKGKIPKGHIVVRLCGTEKCTNPYHLLCGPRGKITAERCRITMATVRLGDDNASSKITDAEVEAIRALSKERDFAAIKAIAEEKEMSYAYLCAVGRSRGSRRRAKNTEQREKATVYLDLTSNRDRRSESASVPG